MHPAFSVIFLTTLIGAGQGLFLALFTGEVYGTLKLLPAQSGNYYATGALISFLFLVGGLIASFFHLGHPERAWRAATRWRTSWLSREVIILPMLMGAVFVYMLLHYTGWNPVIVTLRDGVAVNASMFVGAAGTVVAFALFLCTGMIYACIKFIQEWATALTPINYTLLGLASGFLLATAYAASMAPELVNFFGGWTLILVISGAATRAASLIRNARIKRRSSVQTAIGVRHTKITQRSQGFMGGSFNTREFFHGASLAVFRSIKWLFLLLVFLVPAVLLLAGMDKLLAGLIYGAFVVQYLGLLAERWFFFAQANHPQNIYYQTVG